MVSWPRAARNMKSLSYLEKQKIADNQLAEPDSGISIKSTNCLNFWSIYRVRSLHVELAS